MNVINKLKQFVNKIKSFFPVSLPIGVTEFEAWADDIITLAKLPNNDSLRFALAAMVTNLKPSVSRVSKNFMVSSVRNAAAKQIASNAMWILKEKQKAEIIKNNAETTGSPGLAVVSNEPQK